MSDSRKKNWEGQSVVSKWFSECVFLNVIFKVKCDFQSVISKCDFKVWFSKVSHDQDPPPHKKQKKTARGITSMFDNKECFHTEILESWIFEIRKYQNSCMK